MEIGISNIFPQYLKNIPILETLCKKACPYFLSYTNMNKMNSLHHMKEYPKISNFLQFRN